MKRHQCEGLDTIRWQLLGVSCYVFTILQISLNSGYCLYILVRLLHIFLFTSISKGYIILFLYTIDFWGVKMDVFVCNRGNWKNRLILTCDIYGKKLATHNLFLCFCHSPFLFINFTHNGQKLIKLQRNAVTFLWCARL